MKLLYETVINWPSSVRGTMKCSVASCGLSQNKNKPNLTFHRLPLKESRKREWLENIGLQNIRPGTKKINVCSLHFEESAFNKTLDIVRLKDDAIPTLFAKTDCPSQFALINRANTNEQPSCSGYSHPQDAKHIEMIFKSYDDNLREPLEVTQKYTYGPYNCAY